MARLRLLATSMVMLLLTATLGLATAARPTGAGFSDTASAGVAVTAGWWGPELRLTYDLTKCNTRTVQLPIHSSGASGHVDWGDGASDDPPTLSHTYASVGTYEVSFRGTFTRMSQMPAASAACLVSVDEWGETRTTRADYAFAGATNLQSVATPPGGITNMASMFEGAASLNQALADWDTSSVTNMSSMFEGATSFNGDVSTWQTRYVTSMASMFKGATAFNQDLDKWSTQSLRNASSMFEGATSFNGDVSTWHVLNVTNFARTFAGAASFNQPLASWTIGRSPLMSQMFEEAASFNQDISMWSVDGVTVCVDFAARSGLELAHYPPFHCPVRL